MGKITVFCLLVLVGFTTACSTTDKTTKAPTQLAQGTLLVCLHPTPDFVDAKYSLAGALTGPFSIILWKSQGRELIQGNAIADPAIAVSEHLSALLTQRYHWTPGSTVTLADDKNTAPALVAAAKGKSDYVLSVRTQGWSLSAAFFLGYGRKNQIGTLMDFRLVEVSSGRVIAEGSNLWQTPESNLKHTHDELVANNAALFRGQIAEAISATDTAFAALFPK